MRKSIAFFLLAAIMALACRPQPATAGLFSQMVVFGDSLSDTGNDLLTLTVPRPPYSNGRFSNGSLWVDQLATKLGVPDPTASLSGGTNYAYGGAETGSGSSLINSAIPNMGPQISAYLSGHTPSASQLFVVFGGHNNFRLGETNPNVPVTDIANEMTALAAAGAKNFLVSTLMPLGELPESVGGPHEAALNSLTVQFNSLLTAEVALLRTSLGVNIYEFDTYNVIESMIANRAAYGFTNVTQPVYTGDPNFIGVGTIVGNPSQYLFWDSVHPTTAAQSYIANAAFAAVPEPSTLVMGIAGLAVLGLVTLRKKFRRA